MDLDEESKAILEAAKAKVEYEYMLKKKWENVLAKSAKYMFETTFGVKQGDMVEMRFFSPKKVIYDDICMDDYGDLKVRCFHLKKDGTPRKNASYERWGDFYFNEIKYKQKKINDRNMQAFTIKTNKSDYPFLVIADGFKSAVEVLHQQGIYDTDIISVQQKELSKATIS